MREIFSDWQRRHFTPSGQRSSSSVLRHCSSVPKRSKSFSKSIRSDCFLGVVFMVTPMRKKETERPKHPTEMTTDELLDYVFPSQLADKLRELAHEKDDPEESVSDDVET